MLRIVPTAGCDLGRQIVESDACYFEMAARVHRIEGADLAWMPDCPLPAGCVVHRIDPEAIDRPLEAWLDTVEHTLVGLRRSLARLYLTSTSRLDELLVARGYRRRDELGFVSGDDPAPAVGAGREAPSVELVPVDSPALWRAKRELHFAAGHGPDGHGSGAEDWVVMERAKCETGRMRPYLLRVEGGIVGSVNTIVQPELLRLKNLVIHPALRRRGIAVAAVREFCRKGRREHDAPVACLAIEGSPSVSIYRHLGMKVVARLVEWSRDLPRRD